MSINKTFNETTNYDFAQKLSHGQELINSINKNLSKKTSYDIAHDLLKSQILGKIKLYGIPVEDAKSLDLHVLCDIINTHEAEQIEVSQSVIKTFKELPQNISTTPPHATIRRLNEQVEESDAYKAWEQSLFDKADKYGIHYDPDRPDLGQLDYRVYAYEVKAEADRYNIPHGRTKPGIYDLEDQINEWKSLLAEAVKNGIKWPENDYDPIGLRQEIEATGYKASREQQSLHHYYYSTRL